VAHPQIAVFARLATENAKPTRVIFGQKTLLSRTMHDIRYDEIHDEFLVTNPYAQAILTFRGGANGEEAPIRYIQGPKTLLSGAIYSGLDRVEVDPVHNEVIVGVNDSIMFYPREANGDVAPLRVISSADPSFKPGQTTAVDPIHNVVVVGGNLTASAAGGDARTQILGGGGAIGIFDRTANGKVQPKGVIGGPKTEIVRINQMAIYAPKGWIVATQPGSGSEQEPENTFVGIWSINDKGDVPPRWKLGGPKSQLKKPRGVALNIKNKEIIAADMRLNSVFTFYFPEIF
jgi:hypothetical protein